MTDSVKNPPPPVGESPVPAHPCGRQSTILSQCIPASPSISGLTVLVMPKPDGLGRERERRPGSCGTFRPDVEGTLYSSKP